MKIDKDRPLDLQSPAPHFRSAIIKIASRCNLNCSYCYMYNLGDRTYRDQPRFMDASTMDALIRKIASHCKRHGLSDFSFGFHGGEPLLAPHHFFKDFVARVREYLAPEVSPRFSVQTNGILLTPEWCELLLALDIRVGISMDGPRTAHDIFRLDHRGRGSFDRVIQGWKLATKHGLRPGMLSVVNPSICPDDMYGLLTELKPSVVDFLLPQASYDHPAPGFSTPEDAPYATWLIALFERWIQHGSEEIRIRLFDQIVASVLGMGGGMVGMGRGFTGVVVIETDGSIEPNDLLRACRPGITRTTLNVHRDHLDAAFDHDIIDMDYYSQHKLCKTCQECRIKEICGGGYLPHRYKRDNGFDNPSVYCLDLWRLITHIQAWTVRQIPETMRQRANVVPIEFDPEFDPRVPSLQR